MNYTCEKGIILVEKDRTFDVAQTLSCGQVFRYKLYEGGGEVISCGERAEFQDCGDFTRILCTDEKYFCKYLDFDRNYDIIIKKVDDKALVSTATAFASGIRILAQDPTETLFSFIISANNNILRIQGIIDRLCNALGEDCGGYRAFPTLQALQSVDEKFFESIGAGYRSSYLAKTARAIDRLDLETLRSMPTPQAHKLLCELPGVGPKVADCILLFSLGKTDVFPVDTWIAKVYRDCYGEATPAEMRKRLLAEYGDLSGYVQQYLFYFKRESNK